MNRTAKIVKVIALTMMSLVAAIFFWPFAIGGIVAFFVSGMRFNRRVSSVLALLTAVAWRLSLGEWPVRIGDDSLTSWYFEVSNGIVSWALAAIFVSAFAQWPTMLVGEYKSARTKPA